MEGDGQMIEGLSIGLLSWKAHETLRKTLESYARARLADNAAEFKVFFNEINTLPGFTSISMYPSLMQDHGFTYSGVVEELFRYAKEDK